MIEVDVQMTSDGSLSVITMINWLTQIRSISGKGRTTIFFRQTDEDAVPKFEEVIRLSEGKAYLNIELKDYSGFHPSRFVHPLVALVREFGMHEYSLYSSFRIDFVRALPWDVCR